MNGAYVMDNIVWIKEEPLDTVEGAGSVAVVPTVDNHSGVQSSPSVPNAPSTFASTMEQSNANSRHASSQNGDAVTKEEVKVSWLGESANNEKENEISTADEFDVSEYERKLRENTEQTMNLVMNLCEHSDALKEQQRATLKRLQEEQTIQKKTTEELEKVVRLNAELCEQKSELEKEVVTLKKAADELMKSSADGKRRGIEWHSVDSARFGECFLKEPTSAAVLSNLNVFVADQQLGLFLFSINSELIRSVNNPNWKWAQAATRTSDNHLLVSMMIRADETSPWKRFIMKFDEELNMTAKVEGPKWIEDETVSTERICATSTGFIYLAVAGETFTALYELSPDARWTELYHKLGQIFVDVQVLSVIGPITELLVVERQRGYVLKFSVRESEICARKSLALVEKPGPMCTDELGQLFIADLRQAKIRQLDTGGSFEPIRDIALAQKDIHAISAHKGFLAVTYRESNLVRIHKYKSIK